MVPTSNLGKEKRSNSFSFSIAIPCLNEEQNIGQLLNELGSKWDTEFTPEKIAIFSSECRDRTEEIVKSFSKQSEIPIHLESERTRNGKCHAINRLIDIVGDVDVIVLVSGDVQISKENVKKILKRFYKKNIGVAGGRPVPVSERMNLSYRVSKAMWEIHHLMVLQKPKTTEVTAFRNMGFLLDEKSLVDEAEIEWNISNLGLSIEYCPEALIKTRSHHNLLDYIRQRTRVIIGHCTLAKQKKYIIGSMETGVRLNALKRYLISPQVDYVGFVVLLAAEAWIWLAAHFLAIRRKNVDGRWTRIESAKRRL